MMLRSKTQLHAGMTLKIRTKLDAGMMLRSRGAGCWHDTEQE
jgi:hypothetical protein